MKTSWAEIPSIADLQVEWKYEPENPHGKRATIRLVKKDLAAMLEVRQLVVKVVGRNLDTKGYLLDISSQGLALLLDVDLRVGTLLRLGFFLGNHKIIARGIVRNSIVFEESFRAGIEFIDLPEEHESFITCLNSSKIYRF